MPAIGNRVYSPTIASTGIMVHRCSCVRAGKFVGTPTIVGEFQGTRYIRTYIVGERRDRVMSHDTRKLSAGMRCQGKIIKQATKVHARARTMGIMKRRKTRTAK